METNEENKLDEVIPIRQTRSRSWLWALPLVGICGLSLCVTSSLLLFWQGGTAQSEAKDEVNDAARHFTPEVAPHGSKSPSTPSPTSYSVEGDQLALNTCQDSFQANPPVVTGPLLSPISFATRQDQSGWPLDAGPQFTTTITTVQALFGYAGMENGLAWERVWYFGDEEMSRGQGIWDAGSKGQLTVYAQAGEGGFVPGRYRLELYVEDDLLAYGSFLMVTEETPTRRPVQVAYTTSVGSKHELHLLDLDSRKTEPLVSSARHPAWSPDAVGLLFRGESGIPDGTAGLWVLNLNQKKSYQLSEKTFFDSLSWSPNRIFAASSRIRDGQPQLLLWNLGESKAYSGPLGEGPAWSPEGLRLAYVGCHGGQWGISIMQVISNVFVIDSARLLTDGDDRQPAWSPDGQRIAFVRQTGDNQDIYTIGPDGDRLKRLTDHPAIDTSPAWTPDNRLVFRSNRSGQWGIYLMDADGSNQEQLLETPSLANWEPDRLAVSTDVLLMEPEPSPQRPKVQIPSGHGVLVVSNLKNNDEMTFTIDNKEHKVGPFRYKTLPLKPGHYTWTASWPAKVSRTGIADIAVGQVAYPVVER